MESMASRIARKLRSRGLPLATRLAFYQWLYPATWRRLHPASGSGVRAYLTIRPNLGAGAGHQVANWIAAYHFADLFGLRFAHVPVQAEWDRFLGLGIGDRLVDDLRKEGWRVHRLPLFDEGDADAVEAVRRTIEAFGDRKVIFELEQDQFFRDHHLLCETLTKKFDANPDPSGEVSIFTPDRLSIAVHVRRGDVSREAAMHNPNLRMRFQEIAYFEAALSQVLDALGADIEPQIAVFSQASDEELAGLMAFPGVTIHNRMGALESFANMARADILIASKSSFSYTPALVSRGVRIVHKPSGTAFRIHRTGSSSTMMARSTGPGSKAAWPVCNPQRRKSPRTREASRPGRIVPTRSFSTSRSKVRAPSKAISPEPAICSANTR